MRPTAVDLFAGAGGLSLGFEQAGFDVVAAVEVDPVHAAVHHFNFPKTANIVRSVVDVSADDVRAAAGLGARNVDVVFGGAPCQGFSLMGQRALDDPRNSLVRDFVRLVVDLHASYFVFENVKGLTVGKHRRFLAELIEEFGRHGYSVQLPWRVLNAAHFGVPQSRERLILLGARKGLPLPAYPEPITRAAGSTQQALLERLAGPTCHDALADLPDAERFAELNETDEVEVSAWGQMSAYAREMRCVAEDAWHLGYRRDWNPRLLTGSMRTNHSDISRRRFAETAPGSVEPISRFFKLAPDGVSNTLRAGTDSARGAFTSPRPIHYARPRCVTVREMARLHGFPDWFRLHETKWHGARQIGNSVPPPLARAVASCVRAALGGALPERPAVVLEAGNRHLLSLTPAQAAAHWGVDNPHRARNRKSGATKRRQEDIEAQRLEELRAGNG